MEISHKTLLWFLCIENSGASTMVSPCLGFEMEGYGSNADGCIRFHTSIISCIKDGMGCQPFWRVSPRQFQQWRWFLHIPRYLLNNPLPPYPQKHKKDNDNWSWCASGERLCKGLPNWWWDLHRRLL